MKVPPFSTYRPEGGLRSGARPDRRIKERRRAMCKREEKP